MIVFKQLSDRLDSVDQINYIFENNQELNTQLICLTLSVGKKVVIKRNCVCDEKNSRKCS